MKKVIKELILNVLLPIYESRTSSDSSLRDYFQSTIRYKEQSWTKEERPILKKAWEDCQGKAINLQIKYQVENNKCLDFICQALICFSIGDPTGGMNTINLITTSLICATEEEKAIYQPIMDEIFDKYNIQ